MSAAGWVAKYRGLQLVLRQCEAGFRIAVGDGTLTHYFPLTHCDFNTARLQAYDRAVAFARHRLPSGEEARPPVETIEWQLLPAEPLISRDQTASGTI